MKLIIIGILSFLFFSNICLYNCEETITLTKTNISSEKKETIRLFHKIAMLSDNLSSSVGPIKTPFVNCGKVTDSLNIKTAEMSSPPTKGNEFNITLNGSVKTHQDLKLIVVQTMQEQRILNIENVPKTDVLDSNENFTFTYTVNLPSFFPSGKYNLMFNVQNVNQENIGCISIGFQI